MTKLLQSKSKIAIDLDGTILDSTQRHTVVLKDILLDLNQNISLQDYLEYKREGFNTESYLIHKGINTDFAKIISKKWMQLIEKESYLNLDNLYFDSLPFLEKSFTDFDLILITARNNSAMAFSQIKKLGINKYFKYIFVVNNGAKSSASKVDILRTYNPLVIIGDTEVDYETAVSLNIKFHGLNRGFRSKLFWQQKGIDNTYDTLLKINLYDR